MRNAERVFADVLRGASGPLCMEGLASMERSRVLEANRVLERASCRIQEPLPLPYTSEDPYYRPCPASTAVLDEIHLKGLQVGSCHPGRLLPGRLQDKAFKLGNLVVTALQDQAGCVARLILRNTIQWSTPLRQVQARYPQGAQVLLKEPCLVSEALGIPGMALWVTNPACFQVVSRFPGLAAQLLKEQADREVEAGNWEAAVELYTRCLEEQRGEDAGVLLSRRAQAHLQLGCFFKALRDAERAGSSAYLVRAQALMALRQYGAAAESYKLAGAWADYRLSRRLDEQSRDGKFDIAAAALGGSRQAFPDFVGPVEVGMTRDGKGRGLFATAPLAAGDLVLVHNPLVCKEEGVDEQEADLTGRAVAACLACPRARAQVSSMYQLEAVPSMDVFRPNCELDEQRLLVEQAAQQFDASGVEWMVARSSQGDGDALWTLPRFINHSCLPNTSLGRAGPALYVRAARDLKPGSELLRSYLRDPAALLRPWKPYRRSCGCNLPDCPSCNSPDAFVCKCPRCCLESRLEGHLDHLCSSFQRAGGDPQQLAQLALQVEAKLRELHLGEQHKQWLRTSFAEAYVEYYAGGVDERSSMPPLHTFLESLHATVPGDSQGLRAMIKCADSTPHRGFDPAKVRLLMNQACLLKYGEAGRGMYGGGGGLRGPLALAAVLFLGPLVATGSLGWGPH